MKLASSLEKMTAKMHVELDELNSELFILLGQRRSGATFRLAIYEKERGDGAPKKVKVKPGPPINGIKRFIACFTLPDACIELHLVNGGSRRAA